MPRGKSQMRHSPLANGSSFQARTNRSGTYKTKSISRGSDASRLAHGSYRTPRKVVQTTRINKRGRGGAYTRVVTGRGLVRVNRASYFSIKQGKLPPSSVRIAGAYAGKSIGKTSRQRAAYKVVKQAGYRRSLLNHNPYTQNPVKFYVKTRTKPAGRRGGARRTRRDSKGKYAGSY